MTVRLCPGIVPAQHDPRFATPDIFGRGRRAFLHRRRHDPANAASRRFQVIGLQVHDPAAVRAQVEMRNPNTAQTANNCVVLSNTSLEPQFPFQAELIAAVQTSEGRRAPGKSARVICVISARSRSKSRLNFVVEGTVAACGQRDRCPGSQPHRQLIADLAATAEDHYQVRTLLNHGRKYDRSLRPSTLSRTPFPPGGDPIAPVERIAQILFDGEVRRAADHLPVAEVAKQPGELRRQCGDCRPGGCVRRGLLGKQHGGDQRRERETHGHDEHHRVGV
jgi:hypothetical protein